MPSQVTTIADRVVSEEHSAIQTQTAAATERIVCTKPGCNRTFTGYDRKTNLRRHVREVHEGKKVECPAACGYSGRLDNIRTHWGRKHSALAVPDCLTGNRGSKMQRMRQY
jgi:hypothetical protein